MKVLGVDPGLENAGFSVVTLGREKECEPASLRELGPDAADIIAAEIRELGPYVDAIAIEDYVWRPAKVDGHRKIVHGLAMARMLGRLDVLLREVPTPVHWTLAKDTLRGQPFGAAAKRMGVPGKNDHERSSWYQAVWLLGTLRMAGSHR